MSMWIGRRNSRRGASLVLAAISLTALIGVGAIAVDLGMLYKARADALRAAEAGALAGASAFLDYTIPNSLAARQEAERRAVRFATRNTILVNGVDSAEVVTQVIPESLKVRVRVGRTGIGMWFATVLGDALADVSAHAAAVVEEGDAVGCVQPFMIPDIWDERGQDGNNNNWQDNGEVWQYDGADRYDPERDGYGSSARAPNQTGGYVRDFGRPLTLSPTGPAAQGNGNGSSNGNGNGNGNGNSNGNGNGNGNGNSNGNGNGNSGARGLNSYDFWTFDGENAGNPAIEEAIRGCRDGDVGLSGVYDYIPGNKGGMDSRVRDAIRDRLNADNSTRWDQSTQSIITGLHDWRSSPRVIKIALYDPGVMNDLGTGRDEVGFTNIGLFLLEGVDNQARITGRFLYYVTGTSSGNEDEDGGSLIKHVRLVE